MDKIKAGAMKELIDKAAVVAEIESYISNYKDIVAKTDRNDSTWADFVSMIDAKIDVLQHLISFLNTLEVKDTDDAYKQGYNVNIDIESMVSQYKQRLKSQGGVENIHKVDMCLTAFRHGVENVLEELNLKKLEKE